ncbi:hypothetical protein XENTR_v10020519 [Xenopus tropicalis]|nr:hypothetical protein XENTR_v10020519 [Xenopus tropicalis]
MKLGMGDPANMAQTYKKHKWKDSERHLGTSADIRSHHFYRSVNWAELESLKLPFPPFFNILIYFIFSFKQKAIKND